MLSRYPLHDILTEGRLGIGLFINFAAPALVEMAAIAGFDFIVIDNEHGPIGPSEAEGMIRAAEAARIAPLVRLDSPDLALRFLDLGATGIIFSNVRSRTDAQRAVDAVRFPPLGRRGVAPSTHAAGYGVRMKISDYLAAANELLLTMVTIESPEGVGAIDEILSVSGITSVGIGQMDLSASMGFHHNFASPEVEAAGNHVIACCKAHGVPVMLPGGDAETAARSIERGGSLLLVIAGSWMIGAARSYLSAVRAAATA